MDHRRPADAESSLAPEGARPGRAFDEVALGEDLHVRVIAHLEDGAGEVRWRSSGESGQERRDQRERNGSHDWERARRT